MKGLYPKIMLLVGGVFAVAMIAMLTVVYITESQEIQQEGLDRAEALNRMAFEALYASMRQGGGREGNHQVIARLQEVGAFTRLQVVKGDPVIRQFGAEMAELPTDDLERQALAGQEVQQVRWEDGYRVMRYVTPVRVRAECQRCHHAEVGAINGVISTEISLREYEAALRRRRDILLLTVAGGLVALSFLTFFGLRRLVIQPVQAVRQGATAIAQGDLGYRLQVQTGDELEALARKFNLMASQLQDSYAGLEHKVAERTRELAALNDVAATANRSLKLEEVLNSALEKVLEIMQVEAGEIFLLEEQDGELVMAAHRGLFPQSFRQITRFKLGEGFPGRVAQTGEPLISTDLTKDLDYLRQQVIEAGFGSFACVPLRAKGKIVGTIDVAAQGRRPFSRQEIDLLANIGNQLGLAIENARLYQAEQSQRQLAETLRRTSQTLSSSLDLDRVLQILLEQLGRVLVVDAGLILLRENGHLRVAAVRGRPELEMEQLLGYRLPTSASQDFQQVVQEKRVLTFCQPGRQPPFAEGFRPIEDVDWCLVVPLLRADEVIGLLALEQLEHCYDEDEEPQIALAFANNAVMAIENARLYAEIRAFNEELEARVERRTGQLQEAKEALAQQAHQLRHLLNKTIRIQEEEQDRIAHDIHDGVSQLIMGSLYETQAARVSLPDHPEVAQEKLQAAQEILKRVKGEMQRIVYDLHPAVLSESGLVPALEEHVDDYQAHTGVRCTFATCGPTCRLSPERERAVYRIMQEALHNVAVHAGADQAHVMLTFTPDELHVVVEDNGQGFDRKVVDNDTHSHLGLVGMQERAQSVGGEMQVQTQPGQGTRVVVRVPLGGQ
ncbi:MAG: GAF domain-containing protein [Anaerolineae bacterium]